jgi:hypothetical protein
MVDPKILAQAKDAVSELLASLNITQVVCVDDLFSPRVQLADVQAAQLSLPVERVIELIGENAPTLTEDVDIRREAFRRYWDGLEAPVQHDLGTRVLAAAGNGTSSILPEDVEAIDTLTALVGEDRVKKLAPAEWATKQAAILADAAASRTLVLFDQDLSAEPGQTKTGGIALIKNIVAATAAQSVMCGLLTHTVSLATEYESWQQLAKDNDVDADRFLVIAKEGLRTDPVRFARMLKLVALSPDCRQMKDKVHQLLNDATAAAAGEVGAMTIYDFEHAVLRLAADEGLWEPDMLFRLFAIHQRRQLRVRAYKDEDLSILATRLRGVSHIPTDSESRPQLSTWRMQQMEMYEPSDHLNMLHLPIEIGDIFVKTEGTSNKHFLLLGQPCDLMVRTEGARRPELNSVLLVEVCKVEKPTRYDEVLPYFADDPGTVQYVRLKRSHMVPLAVLDLCVFNEDGRARMPTACPQKLSPAWKARHSLLRERFEKTMGDYSSVAAEIRNESERESFVSKLIEKFPPIVGREGLFKPKLEASEGARVLSFNCRRVKRLHRPRAAALALHYAACFSRPAFDRDLGEETVSPINRPNNPSLAPTGAGIAAK